MPPLDPLHHGGGSDSAVVPECVECGLGHGVDGVGTDELLDVEDVGVGGVLRARRSPEGPLRTCPRSRQLLPTFAGEDLAGSQATARLPSSPRRETLAALGQQFWPRSSGARTESAWLFRPRRSPLTVNRKMHGLLSGVSAAVHGASRSPRGRALWGSLTALSALARLFVEVVLHG